MNGQLNLALQRERIGIARVGRKRTHVGNEWWDYFYELDTSARLATVANIQPLVSLVLERFEGFEYRRKGSNTGDRYAVVPRW